MAFQVELGSHFHLRGPGREPAADSRNVLVYAHACDRNDEKFIMPRGIRFHVFAGQDGSVAGGTLAGMPRKMEFEVRERGFKSVLMTDYRIVGSGGSDAAAVEDLERFTERTGFCVVTVRDRQGVLEDRRWRFRRLSYLLWLLRRSYGGRFTDFYCPFPGSSPIAQEDPGAVARGMGPVEDAA